MASAFHDRKGFIADFLGLWRVRRRRVRIPRARAATPEAARAFADECERYCRLLEATAAPAQPDVAHALHLRAVTEDQAATLLGGLPPASALDSRPTLEQAHDLHPSTRRALAARSPDYARCVAALERFQRQFGVTYVEDLTLDLVQRWLAYLRGCGYAWDTRRHYLLPVRRACKMAASLGLPDPLAGILLDRRADPPEIPAWTLPQLCQAATAFGADPDPRPLAALAMGGFLGLRPSEICRAQVGDVVSDPAGAVLRIGLRERKNAQSRRDLPLPALVTQWLAPSLDGRSPQAPLVPRPAGSGWIPESLGKWLQPMLTDAIGERHPVKALRKSFATWMVVAGIEERHVEAYLGHLASRVAAVTTRHYLAAARAHELRPVAARMDALIRAELVICRSMGEKTD
ncbi:MAG TPA: site-specific integrase [Devosiaceae bacterium]|nr:site-specific integrase [Devosiaceae bacterium]